MTGYGKSVVKLPSRDITIEIKSLNSKQLDLSVRIPSVYSSIDGRIRSEIAQRIERGKVELTMRVENISSTICSLYFLMTGIFTQAPFADEIFSTLIVSSTLPRSIR